MNILEFLLGSFIFLAATSAATKSIVQFSNTNASMDAKFKDISQLKNAKSELASNSQAVLVAKKLDCEKKSLGEDLSLLCCSSSQLEVKPNILLCTKSR